MAAQETAGSKRVHPTFCTVPITWIYTVYPGSRTKATFWRRRSSPIVRKREVVGYRRGSAQTRISVDTGSGDLILEPGGTR